MQSSSCRRLGAGHYLLGYAFLGCALLAVSGCGLAEYEARMEQQQQKMRYWADESRALAPTGIFWPKPKEPPKGTDPKAKEKKETDAIQQDEIFFRPPKGISTSHEEKRSLPGLMYSFPASSADGGPIKEVLVGGRRTPNTKKFEEEILTFLKVTARDRKPRVVTHPDKKLEYFCISEKKKTGVQPTNVEVCFYKEGDFNYAIAFRWDDPKDMLPEDPIKYSLGSLRTNTRDVRIFTTAEKPVKQPKK